jgi:cytochrome P450
LSILVDLFSTSIQRHPVLLREGLGLLRRASPRIAFGKTVLVLDAPGVREVFGRPRDFLNGMGYAQKLKLGPLVLAMDASRRHGIERAAMEHAAGDAWVASFEALVQEHAEQQLGRARPSDFVTDYVEPVLVPSLCELFGVDPSTASSKCVKAERGLLTFTQWLRKLGGALAAASPAPFGLEAVGEAVAAEMVLFLEAQVQTSDAPVLKRLAEELGPDSVARCVGGILLATAALFKAATLAMNQLLRQDQLAAAVEAAAQAGPARARGLALSYVREALRFDPPFAFLTRYCPRPTALGNVAVPADATVVVSLLAAMFDPTLVLNPDEFSTLRPLETYIPFGVGLHECVGKGVAEQGLAVLFAVFLEWLRSNELAIAAPGRLVCDGPAVASYPLVYTQRVYPQKPGAGAPRATDSIDDRRSGRSAAA